MAWPSIRDNTIPTTLTDLISVANAQGIERLLEKGNAYTGSMGAAWNKAKTTLKKKKQVDPDTVINVEDYHEAVLDWVLYLALRLDHPERAKGFMASFFEQMETIEPETNARNSGIDSGGHFAPVHVWNPGGRNRFADGAGPRYGRRNRDNLFGRP